MSSLCCTGPKFHWLGLHVSNVCGTARAKPGRVTETLTPAAGRDKPSSPWVNLTKPNISGFYPSVLFQIFFLSFVLKCHGTNIKAKTTFLAFTELSQPGHKARLQSRTGQGCGWVLWLCQGWDLKGQGSSTSTLPCTGLDFWSFLDPWAILPWLRGVMDLWISKPQLQQLQCWPWAWPGTSCLWGAFPDLPLDPYSCHPPAASTRTCPGTQ